MELTTKRIENLYLHSKEATALLRRKLGRPLTLSDKIFASHAVDLKSQEFQRGQSYLLLKPDRVAMQDATAQMALLQFMMAQKETVAAPTTVHCDHLVISQSGVKVDLKNSLQLNREVYKFLESASKRYGIGFWKPGSGIIHQIILENYAFPGGLMVGTDSHTPNAGGLGMMGIGVGGADAADVMAGLPWEVKYPKKIGVYLKGSLKGWASAKDVILKLCGLLTVKGGTDRIVEYFGPGAGSVSATGKATITNMGAELGATTSLFAFDDKISEYLSLTRRKDLARLAEQYKTCLQSDPEVEKNLKDFYDEIVEIDLSSLEPMIVGPHTPDLARPLSEFSKEIKEKNYPEALSAGLIGSCTNSSYEDLGRAAQVALQAKKAGLKSKSVLLVSPGSNQIYQTIKRDGQLKLLKDFGATMLANACGPCIGQWRRTDVSKGTRNSIVTTFNRNFPARNDGNPETFAFIASPEIVAAMAAAGRIDFNPTKDTLKDAKGKNFSFAPPEAKALPPKSYAGSKDGFVKPMSDSSRKKVKVLIHPKSERLQALAPFAAWDGKDFEKLRILLKAKGKCTTDHISPAGAWLRYRGHLDRISDNMLLGANNAYSGKIGITKNYLKNAQEMTPAETARDYKKNGIAWVVIGDENYGEGSSREHAAMSPRYLGCKAVIARSFARIHETNLKKQGLLPLRFENPSDYEKIKEDDCVSLADLSGLAPGQMFRMTVLHADGTHEDIALTHSFTSEQIEWFKAGSALNLLCR